VPASLEAGVDLVSFSGEQSCWATAGGDSPGRPEIVRPCAATLCSRAASDKLIYQRARKQRCACCCWERWEEIPVLAMIRQPAAAIRARAEALVAQVPTAI